MIDLDQNLTFTNSQQGVDPELEEALLVHPNEIEQFATQGFVAQVPLFIHESGRVVSRGKGGVWVESQNRPRSFITIKDPLYRELLQANNIIPKNTLQTVQYHTLLYPQIPIPTDISLFNQPGQQIKVPLVSLKEGVVLSSGKGGVRVSLSGIQKPLFIAYGSSEYISLLHENRSQLLPISKAKKLDSKMSIQPKAKDHHTPQRRSLFEKLFQKNKAATTSRPNVISPGNPKMNRRRFLKWGVGTAITIASTPLLEKGFEYVRDEYEELLHDDFPEFDTIKGNFPMLFVPFTDGKLNPPISKEDIQHIANFANNFYQRVSYGNVSLSAEVLPWYSVNESINENDDSLMMQQGNSVASTQSIDENAYSRIIYVVPDDGSGHPSKGELGDKHIWLIVGDKSPIPLLHELGHTFGFQHSYRENNPIKDNYSNGINNNKSDPSKNTDVEYGGEDIMGTTWDAGAQEINLCDKIYAGWITRENIKTIIPSQKIESIHLIPLEAAKPIGTMGVRIKKTDTGDHYYFSYEEATGKDPSTGGKIQRGVRIYKWNEGNSFQSSVSYEQNYPIQINGDVKTGATTIYLQDGDTFFDEVNNIRVSVYGQDENGAEIKISSLPNREVNATSVISEQPYILRS